MKKLIVIGAYPNTPKKKEVLVEEIKSLKSLDFDFMLVTHYPVPLYIQEMFDYYIYDKNQTLTPLEKTTYFWFNSGSFLVRINNSRHALPISQSMSNAFKFSEIKNYDFVYFIENDNWFSENDSKKLSDLVNTMFENNKKCIFFKPESYRDNGSYVYETQLFGITPKYFNQVFNLPITEDEYFSHPTYPVSLELGFYKNLSEFEDDFLIINEHSYQYFNESKINIFRVENLLIDLVYNSKNPTQPVLFCYGNRVFDDLYRVIVRLNNDIINDRNIHSNNWFYQTFDLDGSNLVFEIYNNDVLQEKKSYILDKHLLHNLKDKGIIDFN